MKSRITAIVTLVLALSLVFGMTTFAAKSVSTGDTSAIDKILQEYADYAANPEADVEGEIIVKKTTAAKYEDVLEVIEESYPGGKLAAIFDVTTRNIPESVIKKGIAVTFDVEAVRAGKDYIFLHGMKDGSWEEVSATVVENQRVKATFTSFSPIAVVRFTAASSGVPADGTTTTPADTSPKTGQLSDMTYVLAMLALCGLAVVSYKKVRA